MKYPYKYIAIRCDNNSDVIEVQKQLLNNDIIWNDDTSELIFTNHNYLIYNIDLYSKKMTKSGYNYLTIGEYINNLSFLNNDIENKFYTPSEIDNVIFIIKTGHYKKPSYEPKKRIERILESNIHYPYRFKTEDEMVEDYGDNWREESLNFHTSWDDDYPGSQMDKLLGTIFPFTNAELNLPYQENDRALIGRYEFEGEDWSIAWWMLTPNKKIIPTYEPKKRSERIFENYDTINENYFFDNDDMIKFTQRHNLEIPKIKIGQVVTAKNDFLKLYDTLKRKYGQIEQDSLDFLEKLNNKIKVISKFKARENERYPWWSRLEGQTDIGEEIWVFDELLTYGPDYTPKKRTERLLESNQNDVFKIYCDNREDCVKFEDFLHKNDYAYTDGKKYYIREGDYDIATFEIFKNKTFSGFSTIQRDAVSYNSIKNNINNLLNIPPVYTPKERSKRSI